MILDNLRIGVDARQLLINERGISVYISNLLENLVSIIGKQQIYVYVNTSAQSANENCEYMALLKEIAQGKKCIIRDIKCKSAFIWEQMLLPFVALFDKISVLHMTTNRSPFFSRCKLINTIHDTIELDYIKDKQYYQLTSMKGKFYEWRVKQYIRFTYYFAFRRSDLVITLSDASKISIEKNLRIHSSKIVVIPHGLRDGFCLKNLKRNHIMMLGGTAAQKNFDGAVEEYSLLPKEIKQTYRLAVIGCDNTESAQTILNKYHVDNAIVNSFVSFAELVDWYNCSKYFIFLSTTEGFGFPVIEAMACGTIPLVYNISPMNEHANNDLMKVTRNSGGVAERIVQIEQNENLYANIIQHGLKRAKMFSWKNSAALHFAAYNKAVGGD